MSFAPSVTEDTFLTAVRAFLLLVVPTGWEVVQGQDNRVPEPTAANFIVMTPVNRSRLATNIDVYVASETGGQIDTAVFSHSTQCDVQLDIHGEGGADAAQTIATLFRDDYAVQSMAAYAVTPLYATDGHQVPFINAEQQYEDRWVMTLSLQIVPAISTSAQFADTVVVSIEPPVDTRVA
jgi:hypothetical protein